MDIYFLLYINSLKQLLGQLFVSVKHLPGLDLWHFRTEW